MKTTTTHFIRYYSSLLLLITTQLFAQNFVPFKTEIKRENVTLPQTIKLDIPATALVRIEVIGLPKNATFYATFPEDPAHQTHGDSGQARLSTGTHNIEIKDRRNRKNLTGLFHIIAHVSPETDTSEPNNTFKDAKKISLGENTINIFPTGDLDFLKIKLNDRGYLNISPLNPPKGFNGYAGVYDASFKSLGADYVHIPTSGEYYIQYKSRDNRRSSMTPYKIKVDFYPEQDPAEPNNTTEDAAEISMGVWQQALCAPIGDLDLHALDIKNEGRIALNFENVDPKLALYHNLYDAQGKRINTVHPYTVKPGRYYIKIGSNYSRTSLQPYRLKFDLLPLGKITPDTEKDPVIIKSNIDHYTLIPGVETDRFALKLNKLSIVHAQLFIEKNTDYRLSYQLSGQKSFESNNVWFRTAEPIVPFKITTYYGKVSRAPLRVWTKVEEEFDTTEPNDLMKDAAELSLDKPQEFYIYPNLDTDWFKLNIENPDNYYLHIVQTTLDPLLRFNNFEVSIHDSTGKIVQELPLLSREYGFSSDNINISSAGQYHLSVTTRGSSNSPLVIGINKEPSLVQPNSEDYNLDVFMTGVELKPDVAKRMKNMVIKGGGEFINAEKADQIGDKLIEISDKIEKRSAIVLSEKTPGKGGAGKWLLIILGVIILLIVLKKKTQKKQV